MPENVARAEEASKLLRQAGLWTWANKFFENGTLSDTFTVEGAIELAEEADASDLFTHPSDDAQQQLLSMRRGAVAATAAIALNLRKERTQEDLAWARDLLQRAISLPEEPDLMWSPSSVIPWHQAIYVARGLAADIREGTAARGAVRDLLMLIAHPLEVVSLAALEEACKLWPKEPKLTWAALILAFSLCHVPPRPLDQPRRHNEALHASSDSQAAVDAALTFYENGSGWTSLPLPPPAWVMVKAGKGRRGHRDFEEYDEDDAADTTEAWDEPAGFWQSPRCSSLPSAQAC
jgi:hypothetical protein